ncbi:MAG: type IV secretion system DNA-binding domain-containing protein [Candidatus Eisenbacteria bacterium]
MIHSIEALTEQFHAWERRGRGWRLFDTPVDLEPPFVPFRFHGTPIPDLGFDDGLRPTLLSRLVGGIGRLLVGNPTEADLEDVRDAEAEPEPEEARTGGRIAEYVLAVPPPFKVPREAVERFLVGLPAGHAPLAFEVLGRESQVAIRLAFRDPEDGLLGQLKAFFPDLVVTPAEPLSGLWSDPEAFRLIVDFGLAREVHFPLRTFRSFDIDPLIGITAALSDLEPKELGLVQVLFQPVRHPWAASFWRSSRDEDGKPFFLDAPELTAATKEKVASPLYAVVVRVAVASPDLGRVWELARALTGSLRAFSDPAGNELLPLSNDDYDSEDHKSDLLERASRRSGMILNVEELAGLVHPPSESVRSEKLHRQARKTRGAPAIVLGEGVGLGSNTHAGKAVPVALNPDQRSRHMYVIGASGTGKSTLLLNMILQDLARGEGLAVLDPHGDLVDRVLEFLPEGRLDDVVLLNPADADWPVGFNILSAHSELERTLLSSDLVAVFRRLSTSWGDQMTSVLGNAIAAFLESDRGGTLVDLRLFLVEKRFREEFLSSVRDPEIVYYWQHEFPLLRGQPQGSILTRLDTFLRPKLVRYMVAQQGERLDFRALMDQGKILLARLSQGAIGEENAYLLGSLLVSKLQQTALSRQEVAESERRPFYLYIDEFQNFVTPTMEQVLSGARKYRLGLILAHQDLRQLSSRSPEVLNSVLSNPYTRICFRVGDQDARALESGFAHFEAKDLQNLGTGQAIARVERSECDFTLDTAPLPKVDPETGPARREQATARSREKYARSRAEVEAELQRAAPERDQITAPHREPRRASEPIEKEPVQTPAPEQETAAEARPPVSREAAKRTARIPKESSPGRGGQQHKYVQELIRRWGEAHDWRVTIEEKVLDGLGSVDVSLRKGEHTVACEVAVTTDPAHELGNLQKCLAAGFDRAVLVSSEKKTLKAVKAAVAEELPEQAERVHFCVPEEAFAVLESLEAEASGKTKTVRGYQVRVSYKGVNDSERMERRRLVSGVVVKTMKRIRRQT